MFILSITVTKNSDTIQGQLNIREILSNESATELIRIADNKVNDLVENEGWIEISAEIQELGTIQDDEQYAWIHLQNAEPDVNSFPNIQWENLSYLTYKND